MTTRPLALPLRATLVACAALFLSAVRPPDIPFRIRMLDGGASETAAVADINRDGHPDIVSGENWYEGPAWTKHPFRELNFTSNYVDGFSDLAVDVNGDGYPDIVSVTWFARKISWWKNPGKTPGKWTEAEVDSGFPVEFALLVDIDNDGKAQELLPQAGTTQTPLAWYEARDGKWIKHVVSAQSYPHGIGAGDVNKDGRTDILTPRGWAEAPADPRSTPWTFHADWESVNLPVTVAAGRAGRRARRRRRGSRTSGSCTSPTSTATAGTTSLPATRTTTACSGSSRARAASGPAGPSTPPGRRPTPPRSST